MAEGLSGRRWPSFSDRRFICRPWSAAERKYRTKVFQVTSDQIEGLLRRLIDLRRLFRPVVVEDIPDLIVDASLKDDVCRSAKWHEATSSLQGREGKAFAQGATHP